MSDETGGDALGRWRRQRRLSLRELGKLIPCSHVYLWEIENGLKPGHPELIAKCDDRLAAGGQLITIAARGRRAGVDPLENDLGLRLGLDWTECVDTVTLLWSHDAGRRTALRNAVFAAAALTAPVKSWLSFADADPQESHTTSEPQSAASIREMTRTFRRLDNLHGGGEIRAVVVQYLDAEVAPIIHGGTPDSLGSGFISAVAELTQLAGWLAYDSCDHGIGQRYFIQSLGLARMAGDRALGAEILAGMSHQAIFLRQPKRAVHLAQAAHLTASRVNLPALIAEASAMKAHAHAIAREESACVDALTHAETVFSNADRTDDPQWIGYFDEAYFAAISGHCFRALGQFDLAVRFARRSLDMNPGYARGRVFNQLLLAGSYVIKGEIDQACAAGHEALDLVGPMSSARAVTFIDRLVRDLHPWHTDRRVKSFTERSRAVIA